MPAAGPRSSPQDYDDLTAEQAAEYRKWENTCPRCGAECEVRLDHTSDAAQSFDAMLSGVLRAIFQPLPGVDAVGNCLRCGKHVESTAGCQCAQTETAPPPPDPLDKAARHAEEVAQANPGTPCGSEHQQLAEWLRELKARRQGLL